MPAPRPNRREVAALATRDEILRAARRLFAAEGYAATSIQQIAAEAGVSVQTIYSSVGSKAALVLALNDLIDEEAGLREAAAALEAEDRPEQMIALGVRLTRRLNERCGDLVRVLVSTAPSEPDVAATYEEGLRRHRRGVTGLTARLAEMGALSPDMTADRAAAAFSMMTSPASWLQLTGPDEWSFDEAETWIANSLSTLLLGGRKRRR
ncbi:MAG TPA: TetR/AcrR family transcriptional regulator [Nocardioides sp.]|uniref:TetR/AcrR family transcriptional regulator n=1 Tax=Nocardioides sp. TaxID=35761 RepID=UPI002F3FADED